MIVVSLIKPTPNDAFKTHTLSLRILKVHYLGCILLCDGHVSFVKSIYINIDVSSFKWSCLISYIWHIQMSHAFDWPSHIGNCPNTWAAGIMRLNYIDTKCAIANSHTRSVWMKEYSHFSKSKTRLEGDEYETLDFILKPQTRILGFNTNL